MAISAKKEGFKFYIWVALAWTLLWLFTYLVNDPGTFLVRVPNEIWRNVYLVTVLFIFLEYAWPLIFEKRKYIVYNILVGLFFVWLLMMFLSFGLYAWRQFGISLHIYTGLRKEETIGKAIAFQTQ